MLCIFCHINKQCNFSSISYGGLFLVLYDLNSDLLYGMSPSQSSQFASQLNFYQFGIRQHSLLVLTVSLYTLFLLSPSHPSSLPYTDMHTFHRYFIAPSSLSSLLKIWRFLKLWVHSFMLSLSGSALYFKPSTVTNVNKQSLCNALKFHV